MFYSALLQIQWSLKVRNNFQFLILTFRPVSAKPHQGEVWDWLPNELENGGCCLCICISLYIPRQFY